MDSDRRVAVITGAASGLGLAITRKCLDRNMHVVMADINVTKLCDEVEQLSNQYSSEILGVVTDVTKAASVNHLAEQTFEQFSRVDWLFNNAGICGQLAPIWELPTEHLKTVLDVNVFGVLHGIKAFMPFLLKQDFTSRIINMASMYGLCSGSQLAAYAVTKSAIVSLSESMYFDLQRLNKPVAMSVACPSFADTGLLKNSLPLKDNAFHDKMTELLARSRPAMDVAEAILLGVERNQFYIFPDQEVKEYCIQRTTAIEQQKSPHKHAIEHIIQVLSERIEREHCGEVT